MIKAILFDLNKVIVTYNKSKDDYLEKLGVSRVDFWKNRERSLEDYNLGKITFEEFLLNQIKRSNLPADSLPIVMELHENGLEILDGMLDLLDDLAKRYKLILMAGEGKESLALKLKKFGLERYFHKIYATCISGLVKTDPSFYRLILDDNNLLPEEVLFIDDQQRYLDSAQSVGINGIKFEGVSKLRVELNRHLS